MCGPKPIAGCIDGNRKLYRWKSAKGYFSFDIFFVTSYSNVFLLRLPESRALYGDIIIAYKKDFLKHTEAPSGLGKVRQVFKIADIIF